MDPNFVQHSIGDLSSRFLGYLLFVLAYATVIHGGIRAIVPDKWEGSWYDEALIYAVGILLALMVDLNAFFYVAGITNDQYVSSLSARAADGSPSAWFLPTVVIAMCNVLTGALVGGGKKVIVGVAEEFTSGYEKIKSMMDRKANGGAQ